MAVTTYNRNFVSVAKNR